MFSLRLDICKVEIILYKINWKYKQLTNQITNCNRFFLTDHGNQKQNTKCSFSMIYKLQYLQLEIKTYTEKHKKLSTKSDLKHIQEYSIHTYNEGW